MAALSAGEVLTTMALTVTAGNSPTLTIGLRFGLGVMNRAIGELRGE